MAVLTGLRVDYGLCEYVFAVACELFYNVGLSSNFVLILTAFKFEINLCALIKGWRFILE